MDFGAMEPMEALMEAAFPASPPQLCQGWPDAMTGLDPPPPLLQLCHALKQDWTPLLPTLHLAALPRLAGC